LRRARCSVCPRINQISYGLGLDKIHLVIEKSTLGKLSGAGRARAQLHDPIQYALKDVGTTVTLQLQYIFTCK
jgi:hypothetical protein